MPRDTLVLLVAGSRSGVGKTTVASCLIALLREEGMRVRPFKLGPDFIDAGRHALLAGAPCVTLDRFLCTPPGRDAESDGLLAARFAAALEGYDVGIVEAVGGLFDDWDGTGDSPASIARLLGLPVLLVCDGRSSCQTAGIEAAALMQADPSVRVIGAVFPEVSSDAHLGRIRGGVPRSLADRLFLRLPHSDALRVAERHLGLVTAAENRPDGAAIAAAARPFLPVGEILAAAGRSGGARRGGQTRGGAAPRPAPRGPGFRCALARDEAFSFYYPDNLDALEAAGAAIVPFSPLRDRALPDADIVVFGGGFPELYAGPLAANAGMRDSVREAARSGTPMYAECGGLMYLSTAMGTPEGGSFAGAGVFPFATRFDRLVIGYAEVEVGADCILGPAGTRARGHVFHRSALDGSEGVERVLRLTRRGDGPRAAIDEGYRIGNVLATWAHIHFASAPSLPLAMARAARRY